MKCNRQNVLSFWAIFCHFTPLTTQKIKILKKKEKKTPGDILIFHKCTKNHDHMVYCSSDMAFDGCNCYFLILGYFLPFYLPNSPKKNFKKNMKKTPGDTIILQQCTVPEIWHVMNVITFHFGPFSTLLPSNTACKIKIKSKKKKRSLE